MIEMMITGINKEDNMTINISKEELMEAVHKYDSAGDIAKHLGITRTSII